MSLASLMILFPSPLPGEATDIAIKTLHREGDGVDGEQW